MKERNEAKAKAWCLVRNRGLQAACLSFLRENPHGVEMEGELPSGEVDRRCRLEGEEQAARAASCGKKTAQHMRTVI